MPRTSDDDSVERAAHARRTGEGLSYDLAESRESSKRQRLSRIGEYAIDRLSPEIAKKFDNESQIRLGSKIYTHARNADDAPTFADIQTKCFERYEGADKYNMKARVKYYEAIVEWIDRNRLLEMAADVIPNGRQTTNPEA